MEIRLWLPVRSPSAPDMAQVVSLQDALIVFVPSRSGIAWRSHLPAWRLYARTD